MARKSDSPLHGLLLIDKPAGWTSHDVVARTRRLTGQRRIGHTGTLDPAATGLLVLCLGQATRLVEYITAHEKRYTGEVQLGSRTTTDDGEGDVLERKPVPALSEQALRELEQLFTGTLSQVPPAYSAVSVGGQRSYAVARKGGALELAARDVVVHSLRLAQREAGVLSLELHCGPGTYVRSIARDIGERLGCGAHLSQLRRTASGTFSVDEAWTLDKVERIAAVGRIGEILVPGDEGMTGYPAAILGANGAKELSFGRVYQAVGGAVGGALVTRAYDDQGAFAGVVSVSNSGQIRPLKVLNSWNSP